MTNHPANKNKILFRISALLLAGCSFGVGAQDDLSLNIQANILETTCQLTVQNGGAIHLPTVSVNYFSDRGSPPSPILPTDQLGGYPFTLSLSECNDLIENVHFSFAPQSGNFAPGSKQVFISETDGSADGAKNVGLVIFSQEYNTNVLETDGSSDVNFPINAATPMAEKTDYHFYTRYQNIGAVSAGRVTSKVLVSVSYE
ncbi:fimbrial protein [Rahnella victoriana]|uniref:fimbrial-like protein n=1 Tax=Rahnella victoriana TaxID=1510570 RepID=UPI000BB1D68D|nr:fimbrial-like protein [Rahnella victoriana]PBI81990.1 fimbrial protein [Rahnella victoriana]